MAVQEGGRSITTTEDSWRYCKGGAALSPPGYGMPLCPLRENCIWWQDIYDFNLFEMRRPFY